jgi:hypothetical protein
MPMFRPGCCFSSLIRGHVAVDQGRVLPASRGEGSGDDVLRRVVHLVGHAAGLTAEGGGEPLIGHPAEQHGVVFGHQGADGLAYLVVEVRPGPLLRCLHDTIQRDEQARGYLSHGSGPF